jgi:hypothetical protein
MAARFNAEDAKAKQESKSNPFSREYDPSAARLKKGDAGYGQARAGSQTEERAQKAQEWVETEIAKLVTVIREQGDPVLNSAAVEVTITFGKLFDIYADSARRFPALVLQARPRLTRLLPR